MDYKLMWKELKEEILESSRYYQSGAQLEDKSFWCLFMLREVLNYMDNIEWEHECSEE